MILFYLIVWEIKTLQWKILSMVFIHELKYIENKQVLVKAGNEQVNFLNCRIATEQSEN